jgi:hypothetical protein
MNAAETRAYIEHRLQLVSWRGDPAITDDAFALVFECTGGVPRRINNLCTRLLLFGALEERHTLDRQAVETVVDDLRQEAQGAVDFNGSATSFAAPIETVSSVVPIRNGEIDALSQRVTNLERIVRQHDGTLVKFLKLTTQYFGGGIPAARDGAREK